MHTRYYCCACVVVLTLCFIPTTTAEAQLFYGRIDFGAGDYPQSVAIGDLDGDGTIDLAVANVGDDTVSVLLGNENGPFFRAAVDYYVDDAPHSVAIGDLDGDGNPDLAVACKGSYPSYIGGVSILLGIGDGSFQAADNYEAGDWPRSIAIGDLDGDNNLDLAVANEDGDDVSVLLGHGDGTFQEAVSYGAGEEPWSIAIGDLDGDGNPDLAVANNISDEISVLLGHGDGTFETAVSYGAASAPYSNAVSVAINDLDGDNNLDLVMANDTSFNVSVLLGHGDGTFQEAVNYETGFRPKFIAISDLDGDGNPDLIAADYSGGGDGGGGIVTLLGHGDGTFQEAVSYGYYMNNPVSVAISDVDGDGNPDLIAANRGSDNVSVLLGNGDGTFLRAMTYGTLKEAQSMAIGDLDGDGNLDLAVACRGDFPNYIPGISILLGIGDGSFQTAVDYDAGGSPRSVVIGDLDGDNHPDLAVASADDNVSILLGHGDGTFQEAVIYEVVESPRSVAISDLDGDGDLDLAVATRIWPDNGVNVLLGNGDGTFQSAVNYGAGYYPRSVAIGDLDGDNHPDLVVANEGSDNVSILLGLGDGTFQEAVSYGAGDDPFSVAIGDLDGDNHPDVVVANSWDDNVSVLLGNGDGTFQAAVNHWVGDYPHAVAIGDLDGDGTPDLAVANYYDHNASVLLGNGDATFREAVGYGADGGPYSVVIGDLDDDGHSDLAVANYVTDDVTVLINTGETIEDTVSVEMTCVPPTGTLPFPVTFAVELTNNYTGYGRRVDARIDVLTAGGKSIPGWKFGQVDICPGFTVSPGFSLIFPDLCTLYGTNTFTLVAEDVTPAPFNQPPYPPSGDTDTAGCTVTGIMP